MLVLLILRTSEASRLQPAYEQLLLLIYRKEDNVVVEETSLSDSLNVVHDSVQKLKEGSTLEVLEKVVVTTTLSISVTAASASSIPPISVADYNELDAGIQGKVPHSPNIMFEKETLETTPEHPTTS
ncbi:hypothetical protein Tco_1116017 [Tanacetum coccineum]